MEEKKEKPATPQTEEARPPRPQKQQKSRTRRVLVLKRCECEGRALRVLCKYDLPEKAALKLVSAGNAKVLK
ncbi:MAG: hypothetical protein IKU04_08225 [Bacteroidales bacterium]|nr:hypothetical protein [Bacteroidales bacterium]